MIFILENASLRLVVLPQDNESCVLLLLFLLFSEFVHVMTHLVCLYLTLHLQETLRLSGHAVNIVSSVMAIVKLSFKLTLKSYESLSTLYFSVYFMLANSRSIFLTEMT